MLYQVKRIDNPIPYTYTYIVVTMSTKFMYM